MTDLLQIVRFLRVVGGTSTNENEIYIFPSLSISKSGLFLNLCLNSYCIYLFGGLQFLFSFSILNIISCSFILKRIHKAHCFARRRESNNHLKQNSWKTYCFESAIYILGFERGSAFGRYSNNNIVSTSFV